MGILSRNLIKERLALSVENERSIVVTPFKEDALGSDSIDVRLGSHFLFPPLPSEPAVRVSEHSAHHGQQIHIPYGRDMVLPAHQTVLGVTLEFIKLPYDLSGQILTRSSVARSFMVIETAPWVHPSYRGCLTLEIANVSNSALILRPGMAIGQLIFMTVDEPEELTMLSGSFIGPVKPESPQSVRKHSH